MSRKRKIAVTIIRLFLGITFLVYGGVKVAGYQFYHGDWVFDSRTADGTSLVWAFFGFTWTYSIFIGLGELMAGILIMIPRTALIGAILYFMIMTNVVVLNYAYDFPAVRFFSTFLLLCTTWLLYIDRGKLKGLLHS